MGIRDNDTASTKIAAGTTAQRPASPEEGMIRYNSTTSQYEVYNSGSWVPNLTTGKTIAMSIVFGG